MNRLNKVFSHASCVMMGGLAINDKFQLAMSGATIFGLATIFCITLIVLLYRISNKADLVALVKAWRSTNSHPEHSASEIEEKDVKIIDQPPPDHKN